MGFACSRSIQQASALGEIGCMSLGGESCLVGNITLLSRRAPTHHSQWLEQTWGYPSSLFKIIACMKLFLTFFHFPHLPVEFVTRPEHICSLLVQLNFPVRQLSILWWSLFHKDLSGHKLNYSVPRCAQPHFQSLVQLQSCVGTFELGKMIEQAYWNVFNAI